MPARPRTHRNLGFIFELAFCKGDIQRSFTSNVKEVSVIESFSKFFQQFMTLLIMVPDEAFFYFMEQNNVLFYFILFSFA